ncbi:lysophospholipid acyltransferase family protein [Vannielia litorea]|uniref:lysophospholipid acyltransferase family protein n=1 Tax=Vannielia litorea TaxID=1217970 RepID=UPI001BD12D43|nr:lysophospholipid acyltransferase family protein [Vannielia litorea]MBS8226231.1 1-acyl-sn-glycerol-3-phosphate acyltransferase [Vannielia litorea]
MDKLTTAARAFAAKTMGHAIVFFAWLVTAVRGIWEGCEPVPVQRVYFANHTSNGDFVLIWTALPSRLRRRTRAVAAADYWLTNGWRSFIGRDVFNTVLIYRGEEGRDVNPMEKILEAVDAGDSLIIFPEGKRNMDPDVPLLPLKSGIYNISSQRDEVEMVPVWIENLNRVLPKGKLVPVPLLCTVSFGTPMRVRPDESREAFLERASSALLALKPATGPQATSGEAPEGSA